MAAFSLLPMPGLVFVAWENYREKQTKSGFLMPVAEYEGMPRQGLVLAVATDVKDIQPGDRVHFNEDSPAGFKWEGQKILAIHKENIGAIIHD